MWNPFRRPGPPPVIEAEEPEILPCSQCLICVQMCPTGALQYHNRIWSLDLGRCIFCAECASLCPNGLISERAASSA